MKCRASVCIELFQVKRMYNNLMIVLTTATHVSFRISRQYMHLYHAQYQIVL